MKLSAAIIFAGASLIMASDATSKPTALPELRSNVPAIRIKAASDLKENRRKMIEKLMDLAKTPSKPEEISSTRELAIGLLGDYRAVEAIGLLIDNIEYQVISVNFDISPASGYPCVKALASIGVPSLNAIVTRLNKDCPEKDLKLFATVFRLVDGDELAILRAELALKKAEGQQKKNLEQLVELLKTKQWYF